MSNIAFIGLGNMGAPMANNLLKAGHSLNVFDLSKAAMEGARNGGATLADSSAIAVKSADIVVSMLPASKHVEALYLGDTGLLAHISAGTLVIDCSTIAPASVSKSRRRGGRRTRPGDDRRARLVSGGTAGAASGHVDPSSSAALPMRSERARPVLSAMGKNIFHAGPHGAGQTAKICNNMLLGIQMAGTAEALALGVANGLDPTVLSDIMSKSSGRNWALELYNPYPGGNGANVPASRGYSWRVWRRSHAEGPRTRGGIRARHAVIDSAGRTGAKPVQPAQRFRCRLPGFFQHPSARAARRKDVIQDLRHTLAET